MDVGGDFVRSAESGARLELRERGGLGSVAGEMVSVDIDDAGIGAVGEGLYKIRKLV
jgi:hypothetical protein